MAEEVMEKRKNNIIFPWIVLTIIISAVLSGGLTYVFSHRGSSSNSLPITKLPASVQITQDMANKQSSTALSLFNQQPIKYRNSLEGQSVLSSIYMTSKNYPEALSVLNHIGTKWGWTYFLTIQASQISVAMKNYSQAIKYDQQSISLLQSEVSTLTKAANNTNTNPKVKTN